jgi:2-amino-4-hydroxy-6-hydroxymethyldihydropteridine diphosphokinase
MNPPPLNRAYIALGSNIEPERYLPLAVEALWRIGRVVAVSRVWQSRAVGDDSQADFCNAAVLVETPLSASQLVAPDGPLRRIEAELGRVRDPNNKNAARTIDLDLALFNTEAMEVRGRKIPDPEILTRPFLATPLAELESGYLHPVTGTILATIAESLGGDATLRARGDVALAGPHCDLD